MTKIKIILVGAIAIAGLATSIVVHHRSQVELNAKGELLPQRDRQLAELSAEHQRLSNLIVQTKGSLAEDRVTELVKLRREVEELRKQTNTLGRQLALNLQSRRSQTSATPEPHSPEYFQQLHQTAGGKDPDAMSLVMGLRMYASDHQDRFPSNLDQIAPYLRKGQMPLTGTNEFEIVYQGSLGQLKNIPLGAVALVRDRQAWPAPSGKLAKVYGMADGSGLIVESDDNFQSWEAEHIIPPPSAK